MKQNLEIIEARGAAICKQKFFANLATLAHLMKKRDTSTEDIIIHLVKSPVLQKNQSR